MNAMTPQIAELLGAHAGDGTLYKTTYSLVWELRGDLREKEYYTNHICPLLEEIFGLKITSKFRSGGANGCWGVQASKKVIINLFLSFGFKPGTKTFTVSAPQEVLYSSSTIKQAFLRGLFDTDGCLRFDRLKGRVLHTYPRIEISFASEPLVQDIKSLLTELGFNYFVWKDGSCYRICVSGRHMTEKWIQEIKPANPKHLKKYSFWKENGFYEPGSS